VNTFLAGLVAWLEPRLPAFTWLHGSRWLPVGSRFPSRGESRALSAEATDAAPGNVGIAVTLIREGESTELLLVVTLPEGTSSERRVMDVSCSAAADSLAVMSALALDALMTAPRRPSEPPAARPSLPHSSVTGIWPTATLVVTGHALFRTLGDRSALAGGEACMGRSLVYRTASFSGSSHDASSCSRRRVDTFADGAPIAVERHHEVSVVLLPTPHASADHLGLRDVRLQSRRALRLSPARDPGAGAVHHRYPDRRAERR
jgi:hypothetical protein